ncbi:MAG: hypothetical protein GWO81_05235 [Verrucomicrobia bacterium]|nr:hypothetical protein [Verrucomicrobiota bacterium]
MKKPSKLLISQTLAIPAAFSATTYQINQTLSVTPAATFDFQGQTNVTELSTLMFDSTTGTYQAGNYRSDGVVPDTDGFDLAISLFRTHASSDSTSGYGAGTGLKSKSKSSSGPKALVNASNLQINNVQLGSDGTNGSPVSTHFYAGISSYGTPMKATGDPADDGYLGVRPFFYGIIDVTNISTTYNSYPNDRDYSGTKYLGFTRADGIELYVDLDYTYNSQTLTDEVVIGNFVVADSANESLLTYTEFVPVPESKQTAAVIALLAGSAALYRKRRKVA